MSDVPKEVQVKLGVDVEEAHLRALEKQANRTARAVRRLNRELANLRGTEREVTVSQSMPEVFLDEGRVRAVLDQYHDSLKKCDTSKDVR